MKRIFLLALLSSIAFAGILSAQEAGDSAENLPTQDEQSLVVDADNPGMGLLDQATDAKLRANTILDLAQVIQLCERAKKTGLSGENLKYCNQLLAVTRLQRGLFRAQSILNPQGTPQDWEIIRERALNDLEEAVAVIQDQPAAHLRIAQLHLLPGGNEKRAREALNLTVQHAKKEPELQMLAAGLLAKLEPEPAKREAVLAAAAQEGSPQIKLLHALTLFELKRDNEAVNVLQKMIETESGNDELHARVVAELIGFKKYEPAIKILDLLKEKGTDGSPQLQLLRVIALLELKREDEVVNVLQKMIETESGNDELHARVVAELIGFKKYELAIKILDLLKEKGADGSPQLQLLRVIALLELKRDDEAVNVLQKMIETENGNDELHDRIVTELIGFGKYEIAMKMLDLLHAKGKDERKNRIDLAKAELYLRMEQYDDALTLLETLRPKFQDNPDLMVDLLVLRSTVHLAMDDADAALKDLDVAEKAQPGNVPVILQRKYGVLMEQKKWDEALAVAKRLQSLNPEDRRNAVREIHVLTEMAKYDEALEIAKRLRKLLPDEPQWTMILIEIYSKQKAYDKALALAEEQLKENPEELRWILVKAQIYSEQKKWDEAVNWLESCLQKNPDSPELNLVLIGTLADRKSFRAAKERVQSLLAKEPDDLRLLRVDSQMSISLGLHHEAARTLVKVIEIDPKDYTSINNLSWLLSTSPIDSVRHGRRALELAEQASALSRYKEAFVLSTLAAAHAELGDFDKAIEWSQKAAELAKKDKNLTEEKRQELLDHLQKELDTFKRNEPFRELLDEDK